MRLAVNIWEQRGDLMSFQDECIMAAKYMMDSCGVSGGLKVSHAWQINNSDYYFGYTDYSSPFTYKEEAKSTPNINMWIQNGTLTVTGLESVKYKKTYGCFGKIEANKAQFPLFVYMLNSLNCYIETTQYDIDDGYIYRKQITYYAYNDLPRFGVNEKSITPSRFYAYVTPDNSYFYNRNNKGTGIEKQLIGKTAPQNYKTTLHTIINTRYTTDPGLEEAFLDDYGTWTVRSETLPKKVDEVTSFSTSSAPNLFPSGTICTKDMSVKEMTDIAYDVNNETECISEMHFNKVTISSSDYGTYVDNGEINYIRENNIIGTNTEIEIEPTIKGVPIITGDWLK